MACPEYALVMILEWIERVVAAADSAVAEWAAVVSEAIDLVDETTDLVVALADETTDLVVTLVAQEADMAVEGETRGATLADEGHLTLAVTRSLK